MRKRPTPFAYAMFANLAILVVIIALGYVLIFRH